MEAILTAGSIQINETLSTILNRRSVRKYKNKLVSRKLIDKVVEAGKMAPSAMNKQPWKFYIVINKKIIHVLSEDISKRALQLTLKKGISQILEALSTLLHFSRNFTFSSIADPVFYGAPVVIFITSPRDDEWAQLDIGMSAQNMLLAAKSLGLEGCPVGFGKFVEHTQHYSLLQIPEEECVQLSLILGYSDEHPAAHRRATGNVHYIQ